MQAIRLINTENNLCTFEEGTLPEMDKLQADYFFFQTHAEAYERVAHPAPRYQFVITIKGKLRFTVSDGSSFILEPGIILIAKDLEGPGHSWEIIEGDEWHRVYVVPPDRGPDLFKKKE